MPKESDVTDLVMKQLEDNFSHEKAIIMSDFYSPKKEFPSNCIYKSYWTAGGMIGYISAAQQKRLVLCMTPLSFQGKEGEMSRMLKICGNSIIIIVNTSMYTTNVDMYGYAGNISALVKDPLNLWMTKVHTQKELGIAIHKANTVEMNKKLFLTVVLIPEDMMDPFCVICREHIVDKGYVISYGSCHHIFHNSCIVKMFQHGKKECPLDSSQLAGRCERWFIRTDKEVSDDELEVSPRPLDIRPASENIENSCSHCSRLYRTGDLKITSIECGHTYCAGCYVGGMDTCLVCDTYCEDWNETIIDEGEERVPGGLTFEMINSLGDTNRVREDNLGFQNVEPALDGDEEIDEVPAFNEEEEIDEADVQQALLEWFWEGQ